MTIPLVQTTDRLINQLQQNITQAVNPVIANPLVKGVTLNRVKLVSGSNDVAHTLGRTLQGWMIVRQRASATIYDTQDANKSADKTLVLVTSADVTVDLYVY